MHYCINANLHFIFPHLRHHPTSGAGGEVAVEGLGVAGGDEEEGAVVVSVFPGVFDGVAGLADAANAEDDAFAFDNDGAFAVTYSRSSS